LIANKGLACLDLKTGSLTWYVTYPLLPLNDLQKHGPREVFSSRSGLYYLEGSKITPIVADPAEYPCLYLGTLIDSENIYFLSVKTDANECPRFGQEKLTIFNIENKKSESYVIPIGYANHLVKKDDTVIGYGIYRLYSDGDGDCGGGNIYNKMSGGAFRYLVSDKTLKVLSDLPIIHLELDPLKATSFYFRNPTSRNEENVVDKADLSYSKEKDELFITSSEVLNEGEGEKPQKKSKKGNGLEKTDSFEACVEELNRETEPVYLDQTELIHFPVEYETITETGESVKASDDPVGKMLR
jgi:hypothetical protein